MMGVATKFAAEMDEISGFVDVIAAMANLAKVEARLFKSKHAMAVAARDVHMAVRTAGNISVVAYDGAFLAACAGLELAIRALIERFIDRASAKCPRYDHLPKTIRDWYPEGCARLILGLSQDRLSHLSMDRIVNSLASSVKNVSSKMIGEAFSDSDRNYWPEQIDRCFSERLGIKKVWQKASRQSDMQRALGTHNESTTEQVAKKRLDNILQRRNSIVHRGRSYYSPSESEVRECVLFFRVLVLTLAEIMENQIAAF